MLAAQQEFDDFLDFIARAARRPLVEQPVLFRSSRGNASGILYERAERAGGSGIHLMVSTRALPVPGENLRLLLTGEHWGHSLEGVVSWTALGARRECAGFGLDLVVSGRTDARALGALDRRRSPRIAPREDLGVRSHEGPRERSAGPGPCVSLPVGIQQGRMCDEGWLHDFTSAGAWVEAAGLELEAEVELALFLWMAQGLSMCELRGHVVGASGTGRSAVEFVSAEPRLARFREALGALLGRAPRAP